MRANRSSTGSSQLRKHDSNLIERIVGELRQTLNDAGLEVEVYGREKTPFSIWRKMKRKNISFEQLSDIMAFRITVDSVPNCYAALGVIHGRYAMVPERFKDFISTPKPNAYRSLHTTIFGPERRRIEVQIRTRDMHEIAEMGVAAHWAYKQERRLTDGRQYRWVRGLLEILEQASGPEEFLEHTKLEMFQDQVFCFTPRGDLISLPQGATPVDFAYAVHSEVGDSTIGAKVNGRLVPLRTRLNHGDQVEVITSKSAAPSPAWERFVVTGKARSRIRRFLRTRQRNDFIAHGRELLQRAGTEGARRGRREAARGGAREPAPAVGRRPAGGDRRGRARRTRGDRGAAPRAAAGHRLRRRPRTTRWCRCAGRGAAPPPDARDSLISGLLAGDGAQLRRLLPSDPGRHDRRRGAHRARRRDPSQRLPDPDPQGRRRRPLARSGLEPGRQEAKAIARLQIMTTNQPGSLGSLSTVVGKQGGNITDVRFGSRSPDLYEIVLDIEVEDRDHLERIVASLRATPVVTQVERTQG